MVLYPGLVNFVKDCLSKNIPVKDIYKLAKEKFEYSSNIKSFRSYVSNVNTGKLTGERGHKLEKVEGDIQRDDIKFLKILMSEKILKITDFCNKLNCPPKRIFDLVEFYRTKGYELAIDNDKVIFSTDVVSNGKEIKRIADTEIIFGIASDWHIGSKATQITALKEFCNICKKRGVKHIFVPGDIVAGFNVYPGQAFDLYALSAEEQEASVINNVPKGFEYYCLGGNHDYSFIRKGGGHNPLLAIASQREDFHYVGFDEADIPILKGVDVKMWHPSGGVPYSVSYRLQKGIEQVAFTELTNIAREVKKKPTVRFVLAGHLHVQMQALFGSIFGCQCGAFEGQTNYLKRKSLVPAVGGYIIQTSLGHNGLLKDFDAKFYLFDEIDDDWKNYKHDVPEVKVIDPIFEE